MRQRAAGAWRGWGGLPGDRRRTEESRPPPTGPRAGRSPGYFTASPKPRSALSRRAAIGRKNPPCLMWTNSGSPRAATNEKAPGQRPAREGRDRSLLFCPLAPPPYSRPAVTIFTQGREPSPLSPICAVVAMLSSGKDFTSGPRFRLPLPAEGGRLSSEGSGRERVEESRARRWGLRYSGGGEAGALPRGLP